ncbi:MAG: GyrI-like domain-containing protein [Agathobacter sp.]|nr:GyrI-like domain-containing protein [Agathobacter sp.]
MNIEIITKKSFCVIGKEGSTDMGEGFIRELWNEANNHFDEIAELVKKDSKNNPVGYWGAMSNFSMEFMPWEDNFTKGKYLAGAECYADSVAPMGWSKWIVPGFQYVKIRCDDVDTFPNGIKYIAEQGYRLAGAVHDYTDASTGQNYMYFPIKKL